MNKSDLETKLIDANALMEFARNHVNGMIDCNDIARFPTVAAESVRHGKWEEYQIPHIICCSECDYGTCVDEKTKFCPNCGAKMDLED